jgi:signal peptidase I
MTEAALDLHARPERADARSWWRLAGSLIGGVLFGSLLGLAALTVVATQFFGFRVLTVSSDSMYPALAAGDVIVVKPTAIDTVEVGDIVLFEAGGDSILTVHRVVGRNEIVTNVTSRSTGERTTFTDYRLKTQGDANPAPDGGEVGAAQLQGRLWFSFRDPLAGAGVPMQAVLFVLAGATGAIWATWELAVRARTRALIEPGVNDDRR